MAKSDHDLNRLLRAAAGAEAAPGEMPYGFDTRVLALARGEGARADSSWELAHALRRVAFAAALITLFASSAAYWQASQNDELSEPLSNTYAIADNAIEAEFFP
jgi:hypothetical protein